MMLMNFQRIVLTFSSLFLLFACTKKQDHEKKVLNIVVTSKVKGMDPIYANDLYSSNEVARVYEGLLEYHYLKRPYELRPNLAASLPKVSKDGLTYTFKIKKGVTFHDNKCFEKGQGRELVAQDFVYSIKRMADAKNQGLGWWLLDQKVAGLNEWRDLQKKAPKTNYDEGVEGLKALDKHTLQIKLTRTFPQFLYALAMPFFFAVPRECVEFYGKEFLNHPVGTGPFILPEFKQTTRIVYKKNPKFRAKFYPSEASEEMVAQGLLEDAGKKLPLVDEIIVNIMEQEQPRWLKFQKGGLDFVSIPKDNFASAVTPSKEISPDMKKKNIHLAHAAGLDIAYMAFNNENPLFKNKKLRQAMSLAYDSKRSNELFYNGMAQPAQSIVPPGIAGFEKNFVNDFRAFNLEGAKKLLAEAGYPNGSGLPEVTYDTSSSTTSRQMGEFFKKSMAKIGIKVRVVQNPWPELQKKIRTRSTMVHAVGWGADYPDAENFLQLLYGPNKAPGSNGSNYNNEEFNALFEKASKMQHSEERTQLYQKLNRMAAREVPLIYGVHRMNFVMRHGWLKNYVLSEFNAGQGQYLNVDLEAKKTLLEKL